MPNKIAHARKLLHQWLREGRTKNTAWNDAISFRGGFTLSKRYANGSREVVLHDPNLVVNLGRRVMSRLISGVVSNPTITRGVSAGMRVIRSTSGGATSAWVKIEQVTGNEYKVSGNSDLANDEFSFQFLSGTKTLSQLASDISAVTGWRAEAVSGMGSVEAAMLLVGTEFLCIGDQASYSAVPADSPYVRTLYAVSTKDDAITNGDLSRLSIARLRFGTEGYDPNDVTKGRDALATDEQMNAGLRASDLGESLEASTYLPLIVSYPNTPHVQFSGTLGASQANGLNISEAGLFTNGDYLVAKKNFGQITKANTFELVVDWVLIF